VSTKCYRKVTIGRHCSLLASDEKVGLITKFDFNTSQR